MSVHYTYRTRCFYMLPDGTFPMMLRDHGQKKLWQLPGGGIDDAPKNDPYYIPKFHDIYEATIRETKEELGWDVTADGKHPYCGWTLLEQREFITRPNDPDWFFWQKRGIVADEVVSRYYFLLKQVDYMPKLELAEPDKFSQLVMVRENHMYEDVPFVQGAQYAHGVEKAYVMLGLALSDIKAG